jgi:hypothetical protein
VLVVFFSILLLSSSKRFSELPNVEACASRAGRVVLGLEEKADEAGIEGRKGA